MRAVTTWLLLPATLVACACAPRRWTPPETTLPAADVLQLAELALAEEIQDPILKPTGDPHVLYVRIP